MERDNVVLAAIAALAAPATAVLIRMVDMWTKRGEQAAGEREKDRADFEKRREAEVDRLYSRIRELEAETVRQRRECDDLLAAERREHERLVAAERQTRETTERDRDRGWDLARAWNARAHDERHAHINAIQRIIARQGDAEGAAYPVPAPLPRIAQIVPENGKEQPK